MRIIELLWLACLPVAAAAVEPSMNDFEPHDDARPVLEEGFGRLQLHGGAADEFVVYEDSFEYAGRVGRTLRIFPTVDLEWIQTAGSVIPLDTRVQDVNHPDWEIAFQAGRVWQHAGHAQHHYAIPFALLEKNANCTHNGMLRWTINSDGEAATAAYLIASETCAYFKFDMWGELHADVDLQDADPQRRQADDYLQSRAARLPVAPIATINAAFPKIDSSAFGPVGKMKAEDMTVYGFIVNGRHYRSDCATRRGAYPACDDMLLPSYSTAKSVFAGLALMRLQELVPGATDAVIGTLVDECAGEDWADVTIENALDMATGHYLGNGYEADESLPQHVEFLYAERHADKIEFACDFFPRRSAPGTVWVYHSSDSYLAGTAMRALLEARRETQVDIYAELLVAPFWRPMRLSPVILSSRQTADNTAQALAGWGLSYLSDDIARIAAWLVQQTSPDGLDPHLYAGAMQRRPDDPGLAAGGPGFRYNNGFWAHDIAGYIGCADPVWVPFMSGYGGISVVLFPNETVYYYFSDGYTQRWREAAVESNKIRNMCQ